MESAKNFAKYQLAETSAGIANSLLNSLKSKAVSQRDGWFNCLSSAYWNTKHLDVIVRIHRFFLDMVTARRTSRRSWAAHMLQHEAAANANHSQARDTSYFGHRSTRGNPPGCKQLLRTYLYCRDASLRGKSQSVTTMSSLQLVHQSYCHWIGCRKIKRRKLRTSWKWYTTSIGKKRRNIVEDWISMHAMHFLTIDFQCSFASWIRSSIVKEPNPKTRVETLSAWIAVAEVRIHGQDSMKTQVTITRNMTIDRLERVPAKCLHTVECIYLLP